MADAGEVQLVMYNTTAMVARVERSSIFMMISIVSRMALCFGWKVKANSDDLIATFLTCRSKINVTAFSWNIFIFEKSTQDVVLGDHNWKMQGTIHKMSKVNVAG